MAEESRVGETELEYWKRIADQRAEQWDRATQENLAWRARFPQYEYRPQDDCVALKQGSMDSVTDRNQKLAEREGVKA